MGSWDAIGPGVDYGEKERLFPAGPAWDKKMHQVAVLNASEALRNHMGRGEETRLYSYYEVSNLFATEFSFTITIKNCTVCPTDIPQSRDV